MLMKLSQHTGLPYLDLKSIDVFEFFTIISNIEKPKTTEK
jgi:hypothetical protein